MAAIGAFVGIAGVLFVLFFSSVIALISYFSFAMKNRGKGPNQDPKILPYGPFLALSTFLYILLGELIVNQYLNLFVSLL